MGALVPNLGISKAGFFGEDFRAALDDEPKIDELLGVAEVADVIELVWLPKPLKMLDFIGLEPVFAGFEVEAKTLSDDFISLFAAAVSDLLVDSGIILRKRSALLALSEAAGVFPAVVPGCMTEKMFWRALLPAGSGWLLTVAES